MHVVRTPRTGSPTENSRFSTATSPVTLRSRTRPSSTTSYLGLRVTLAANSRWERVIRGSSSK